MACSCAKSQIGCTEFCKCEENCENIWNAGSSVEDDCDNSDKEESASEDENE